DIALLIYGSPLVATTHMSLIKDAVDFNVSYKVINSSSIFDAIAESGLQLYKFGKITSMPQWDEEKNYTPDSFVEIILENKKINSHSLILCDIGLGFKEALEQLKKSSENKSVELNEKLVVCEALGTKDQKFYYGGLNDLIELNDKNEIKNPFCLIIPGELQKMEKEIIDSFSV
ncbi:MAG TPA: SAM-dependent methyltransferase, partial [Candidatus Nanoarchaeia archaeon]|nr:SAM-dependent methyltransferase [Candidatus Nanoarchaeia archaeon]